MAKLKNYNFFQNFNNITGLKSDQTYTKCDGIIDKIMRMWSFWYNYCWS